MNAATVPEWLTAFAIGTGALPLFAAAVYSARVDLHTPRASWDWTKAAAARAVLRARLRLAALLMLAAWHLEATR